MYMVLANPTYLTLIYAPWYWIIHALLGPGFLNAELNHN
jgi:hypothetical protein